MEFAPGGALFQILAIIGTRSAPLISGKEFFMLMTLSLILLILWAVGLVSSYTMGGYIHLLLVIAIVVFLTQIIQNRKSR